MNQTPPTSSPPPGVSPETGQTAPSAPRRDDRGGRRGPGGPGGRGRGPRPPRPQAPSEFDERIVQIDRVARVVKGGRRFRFRATVVLGDRKGKVGLGISKGADVQTAIRKAVTDAKKNMIVAPIIEDSIPFEMTSRFAGAKVLLKPARRGTGIIAGGAVRPVIELAGITNVLSKSLGSNNRINNAKAALLALKQMADSDLTKLHDRAAKRAAAEASTETSKKTASKDAAKADQAPPKKPAKSAAKPAASKGAKS